MHAHGAHHIFAFFERKVYFKARIPKVVTESLLFGIIEIWLVLKGFLGFFLVNFVSFFFFF